MSKQPEVRVERGPVTKAEPFAIGMAKLLEREGRTVAAAELHRQHGEIKSMQAERMNTERRLLAVEAQRDALLEALRYIGEYRGEGPCTTPWRNIVADLGEKARAAIKAVEGGK